MKLCLADYISDEKKIISLEEDKIEKNEQLLRELHKYYVNIDAKIELSLVNHQDQSSSSNVDVFQNHQTQPSAKTQQNGNNIDQSQESHFSHIVQQQQVAPMEKSASVNNLLLSDLNAGLPAQSLTNNHEFDHGGRTCNQHLGLSSSVYGEIGANRQAKLAKCNLSARGDTKSDIYRKELLQQIEGKKKQKQMEIEHEKAAEQELEKKIARQRLAMYGDYLEERKKGDFISKPVRQSSVETDIVIGHQVMPEGDSSSQYRASSLSSSKNHHPLHHSIVRKSNQQHRTNLPIEQSILPSEEKTILANLTQVRQTMQHDHLEMLQQLLDMHL